MSKQVRLTDEFKRGAVAQVVERGHAVSEVNERLGISSKSLYGWKAQFSKPVRVREAGADLAAELRRVKKEMARVSEERGILKGHHVLRARVPVRYRFIRAHRGEFSVRTMCRALIAHFSGFHAWLKQPLSHCAKEDVRQTDLIRQAWAERGKPLLMLSPRVIWNCRNGFCSYFRDVRFTEARIEGSLTYPMFRSDDRLAPK